MDAITKQFVIPVEPQKPAKLPIIYPWETTNLYNLCTRMYALAVQTGYKNTFDEFKAHFGDYLESGYSVIDYDEYTGEYIVTPLPNVEQILRTSHKIMRHDVTIEAIPYSEVDNTAGGVTVMIG